MIVSTQMMSSYDLRFSRVYDNLLLSSNMHSLPLEYLPDLPNNHVACPGQLTIPDELHSDAYSFVGSDSYQIMSLILSATCVLMSSGGLAVVLHGSKLRRTAVVALTVNVQEASVTESRPYISLNSRSARRCSQHTCVRDKWCCFHR